MPFKTRYYYTYCFLYKHNDSTSTVIKTKKTCEGLDGIASLFILVRGDMYSCANCPYLNRNEVKNKPKDLKIVKNKEENY